MKNGPKIRAMRFAEMNSETHEIMESLIPYECKQPEPEPRPEIWCDQSPYFNAFLWMRFASILTPAGIRTMFKTFESLIEEPRAGYSKRRIKREILSNPNLHTKLKARLLMKLKKASVRGSVQGHREADDHFCNQIMALTSKKQAIILRQDIEKYPCLPEKIRENLLFNLSNYELQISE